MKRFFVLFIALLIVFPSVSFATDVDTNKEDKKQKDKQTEEKKSEEQPEVEKKSFEIPNSVLNIAKDNTYTNPTQEQPYLQPSELAQELIETSEAVSIENPDLVKILNESTIQYPKLAIAFRASIYLGEWPLSYESEATEVNWEYQKVNTNYVDNRGGNNAHKLTYYQEQQKKIAGGLTAKIPNSEAVQKMMMIKATEVTHLPLSFDTVIGQGTKKTQTYNVAPRQVGYLHSYVPAVHETGKVTYGEVYLTFKGGKPTLEVKNVTQQGIGAWIPIQDHLSFTFIAANQPR
ncbi:hypothetical protein AJ85_18155 [Alkalihalobacillus alcalophilus ATCC 27647 = CGMCC 1.3604]|uniref:YfkD-like protein n=1 Tax=Alkalihalobacillus alcalophilus ATCC 27647 = CGMCC 1.3604 TaxID=1218173 RepID=A0A094WGB1_ALKAL|nr:YfkD famly protein [Alkalihalobacillus alcalophilus]KGA96769.1 hypothetical protein BALCAV_0214245 [Alkalihalobacillus alcalophilus ATCC 27647 = CGMCC 1.3604]MED1563510.1 YfkD family protein [Alkalihalobacillus alcalophilus]THG92065.1 hypothetical protein AJ85_18155 [Alkalihalobacillus alcalophilus ATCC 27647 = CGMCC 1.3604]